MTLTDLFEQYETLPANVRKIIDNFQERDNSYHNCKRLQKQLETVGYTCDYGLDADPYDLRKID